MQSFLLKFIRVIIVLMLLISTGATLSKIEYIQWPNLANTSLTLIANLVFLYFSSLILFTNRDYSSNKLIIAILGVCTLVILSQLFNIVVTLVPTLIAMGEEIVFLLMGYLYIGYVFLVVYYITRTWLKFNQLRVSQV